MPQIKATPIGRLRNLCTIYAWKDMPVVANGQAFPEYTSIGQEWVAVDPQAGQMMMSGAFAVGEVGFGAGTDVFIMRYREDLTHEHLIEVKGQRYRITRVLPDDRRRFLTIHCEIYGDSSRVAIPRPPVPLLLDRAE